MQGIQQFQSALRSRVTTVDARNSTVPKCPAFEGDDSRGTSKQALYGHYLYGQLKISSGRMCAGCRNIDVYLCIVFVLLFKFLKFDFMSFRMVFNDCGENGSSLLVCGVFPMVAKKIAYPQVKQ